MAQTIVDAATQRDRARPDRLPIDVELLTAALRDRLLNFAGWENCVFFGRVGRFFRCFGEDRRRIARPVCWPVGSFGDGSPRARRPSRSRGEHPRHPDYRVGGNGEREVGTRAAVRAP